MNPLISVIVPVYNGQAYVLKCLQSVEQQTYDNLEIILVDDGSTDYTSAYVKQFADRINGTDYAVDMPHRRMKILTLGDEGVSVARNRALDVATGEYVTFIDADDCILPNMIQNLFQTITESKSDVVGCKFFIWKSDEEWEAKRKTELENTTKITEYSISEYDSDAYYKQEILKGNSRCWSKLYRRATIGDLRFDEKITIGEDMLFLLQLRNKIRFISEISYEGYGYYQNPVGAMNRKFSRKAMDQITCWELARELVPDKKQIDSFILVAIMLVVGRLAELGKAERSQYKAEIAICNEKMSKYYNGKAFSELELGYKVKVLLFRIAPSLYINMYHLWKAL